MPQTGWSRLLVAALVVDLVAALVVNVGEAGEVLDHGFDLAGALSVVGLIATLVVVVVAIRITTTLRATRREMHRRGQSLDADASISSDWLWESDLEDRLTYSNDGVRALLGYEPADVIGRDVLTLLAEDQRDLGRALIQRAVEDDEGWDTTELTWLHADGTRVALHGKAAPIKDESGRIIGFRGQRRGLTAAEHAERTVQATRDRVDAVVQERALDVALQPIVDLGTGRLGGAEALARFRDGRSPDAWFADAQAAGMSLELDRLAFGRALELIEHLPLHAYLSINATPELVLSGHLTDALLGRGLTLSQIVIEITEHARIDDYDALHLALTPLREQGVCLAIDDTGAGYASLSHVLRLRPDIIKIDRSLIERITSDPARRSLVTALVLLALDLDARITAEGIETPSELETLAILGADHGQGYLLGRPSTDPSEWQRWAARNWLAAVPDMRPGHAYSQGAGGSDTG